MPLNLSVQIPTLVGSCLSSISTLIVLGLIIARWAEKQSLRHVLMLNLILSEFINSTNNSISGIYSLVHGGNIPDGPACTANGWIGQFTVQAADFSVLFIAISTLIIVTQRSIVQDSSWAVKLLVSAGIWLVPVITSSVAAGSHAIGPVSGNWCWIVATRTDLRYGLGHGIRYAIIILTIIIYTLIFIYLKRKMKSSMGSASASASKSDWNHQDDQLDINANTEKTPFALAPASVAMQMDTIKKDAIVTINVDIGEAPEVRRRPVPAERNARLARKQNISSMMLLRAYPVLYILLWIPGIANRIAEATNHPSKALQILQASTQFIGFADAIAYLVQGRLLRN